MASAVVVGVATGTADLQTILDVAKGQPVALDTSTAERLKKESPAPKDFKPETEQQAAHSLGQDSLSSLEARAAVFCRLISLAIGSTKLRPAVVQSLVDLLNSDEQLDLKYAGSDAGTLNQIANSAAKLSASGLSAEERSVLESGQAVTLGVAAIATQAAIKAVLTATAVAAVTAEALQTQVKGVVEDQYAGKATNDVVGALTAFLKDSPRVNPKKGAQLQAFAQVPQVHGAAGDSLSAASASLRAVLSLPAQAAQVQGGQAGLSWLLMGIAAKLLAVAELSIQRMTAYTSLPASQVLVSDKAAAKAGFSSTPAAAVAAARKAFRQLLPQLEAPSAEPSLAAARAVATALEAVHRALAGEALLASVSLSLQEAAGQANAKPAKQAPANAGKGKPSKKGKGGPSFGLGKGTALVRAFVNDAISQHTQGSAANGTVDGSTSSGAQSTEQQEGEIGAESSKAVLQLAQQVEGSGKEEEGQGSVPELLGEPSNALDRRTAQQLQHALEAVQQSLDPLGKQVGPLLADLQSLVESNQTGRKPKAAKGTRDLNPEQMAIREVAFSIITSVFKRHGAVCIDTPVFELRETLMGKYGEDTKLIYDLADQGGEILSLRYDLTVPFARYVAQNAISNIKRYHIAKVYRRDQPQMTRGRFREFYQCDLDIAGVYPTMVPDAEVLKVLSEILSELQVGEFVIKLNHRRLLDAMMDMCGVPPSKFRPICSAIDKLDKEPWEAVRAEMVDQKGLPARAADAIGRYVRDDVEPKFQGQPEEILQKLQADPLAKHPAAAEALSELSVLFKLLAHMQGLQHIDFNMSLARGLDYYTGVIYEAVMLKSWNGGNPQVGSVAAGGRYDKLVGMFSSKDVPAVGVSIGIERIFNLLEDRVTADCRDESGAVTGKIKETATQVLVVSIGKNLQPKRMEICAQLWAKQIRAEFGYKATSNLKEALAYADDNGIPYVVLFGESELASQSVKVKHMETGDEEVVALADLTGKLQQKVKALDQQPFDLVAKKRQAPAAEQTPSQQSATTTQSDDASRSAASTEDTAQPGQALDSGSGASQQKPDEGLKGLQELVEGCANPGVVHRTTQSLSEMSLAEQIDKAT